MNLASQSGIEHFRGYLRVLADMQLDPRLRVKEDVSSSHRRASAASPPTEPTCSQRSRNDLSQGVGETAA